MSLQESQTTRTVSVQVSHFTGASGVSELHIIVRPNVYADFETQLAWINEAYRDVLDSLHTDLDSSVFRRFFCSDLVNQAASLELRSISNPDFEENECAISWVCQPPAFPAKCALWAYHVVDPAEGLEKTKSDGALSLSRGALTHHWDTNLCSTHSADTYLQTLAVLEEYCDRLDERDATLYDNAIRTWFFVKDVDTQYQALVDARNDIFHREGLTEDSHYIASTGIAGSSDSVEARVSMDAYSISNVKRDQINFISALDYLSPTQLYGVAFERATSVSYRDRKHIFVSGTASIDWQGQILYPNNVVKQLQRVLTNIEALLRQARANVLQANALIVYLRDPLDQEIVSDYLEKMLPETPFVIVTAAVCRPGWLIEIETIATIEESNPELPEF